jgi:hypothetical protein
MAGVIKGKSTKVAHSSIGSDDRFPFFEGLYCPIFDFVFAIWIMILFDALLTSLVCIAMK